MIVTGGRGKNYQELMSTEVYDTETSEWMRFSPIGLFRHTSFIKDNYMYVYGGFENSNPNNPVDKLITIDLLQYFKSNNTLSLKIESLIESKKENKSSVKNLLSQNNSSVLDSSSKNQKKRMNSWTLLQT